MFKRLKEFFRKRKKIDFYVSDGPTTPEPEDNETKKSKTKKWICKDGRIVYEVKCRKCHK